MDGGRNSGPCTQMSTISGGLALMASSLQPRRVLLLYIVVAVIIIIIIIIIIFKCQFGRPG
jgi:hypothetical protein